MSTVYLRGCAFRFPAEWAGLDPAVVPETVAVYVEYDYSSAIGTAALRRDGDEIWADAAVEDGSWRETCRYFGMSFLVGHLAEVPGAGWVADGVSLTKSELGLQPPFEVVGGDSYS